MTKLPKHHRHYRVKVKRVLAVSPCFVVFKQLSDLARSLETFVGLLSAGLLLLSEWAPGMLPHWIFNHDVREACPWRLCDFNLVHQVAGSDELQEHCCVFKLAQGYDDIVAAAVYREVFLKRTELEWLFKGKKTGSGKNGGVVKLDLA